MSTKNSILATVAVLIVWLIVVGVIGARVISSARSEAEIRRRGSDVGGPAGLALVFCISPIWIWWNQSRRALREKEDQENRPKRKRRAEKQDEPKARRRRADSGSGPD